MTRVPDVTWVLLIRYICKTLDSEIELSEERDRARGTHFAGMGNGRGDRIHQCSTRLPI